MLPKVNYTKEEKLLAKAQVNMYLSLYNYFIS